MEQDLLIKETEYLRRQLQELRDACKQLELKESACREESRRLSQIVNNMFDAVAQLDNKGIFVYISPSHEKIFGFKPENRLGLSAFSFIHPDDQSVVRNMFNQHLANREACTLEFRYRRGDGRYCWVETSGNVIVDDQDRVEGIVISTRPIEERKQTELALKESEKKFRTLIESSNVGISITDGERFLYVNPVTRKMSGYSEEEYLSRPVWDFVTPESRDLLRQRARDRLAGKPVPDRYEISVLTGDGSVRWAEVGAAVIEYEGKPAIIFTQYDITDRKTAEAEKEALRAQLNRSQKAEAIGTLAAGIAHDFNNVLSGIQGHCSLIQVHLHPDDPYYQHLKGIENQVRSGAHLTRQLLDMSGSGSYEMKPTDLNGILKESAEVFSRAKKGIAVSYWLERSLWPVEANAGQIDQIFLNLFINAAYAMNDEGDLYLETKNLVLREDDERPFGMRPGRYVQISVTDTGSGMDRETMDNAFKPFFTTKGREIGTGLGLASAYSIVKNHRGYITVESQLGVGSTFRIYLPATEKAVAEKLRQKKKLYKGSETILLVDDETIIADTTKDILEMLGYRVMLAGSGQEAIAVFMEKGSSIDLVILDMVMPGMGGLKVFGVLRSINPDIRIILYSGYAVTDDIQNLMDRGRCGFIQKPFGMEDLSVKIREIIEQQGKR